MGRDQSSDQHIVIHSSIALLQERFKQLERMKEMREERELLRMIHSDQSHDHQQCCSPSCSTMHYEPSRLFFHSELILPPRPPSQVSLSLWPNSQSKCSDFRGLETSHLMKTWPIDTPLVRASSPLKTEDSDSDVDTSLHL